MNTNENYTPNKIGTQREIEGEICELMDTKLQEMFGKMYRFSYWLATEPEEDGKTFKNFTYQCNITETGDVDVTVLREECLAGNVQHTKEDTING